MKISNFVLWGALEKVVADSRGAVVVENWFASQEK